MEPLRRSKTSVACEDFIRTATHARQECPVDAAGRHAGQMLTACLLAVNFG